MNIYFAGSIRGGREDADLYRQIIDYLGKYGTVLTEHVGSEHITDQGEGISNSNVIHDRDMNWLEMSDIVVAEVTVPSLGVGYEIGRAVADKMNILCLFREGTGRSLSAMISGSKGVDSQNYKTLEEAKMIIDKYFEIY